jgi:hypothetical protein
MPSIKFSSIRPIRLQHHFPEVLFLDLSHRHPSRVFHTLRHTQRYVRAANELKERAADKLNIEA